MYRVAIAIVLVSLVGCGGGVLPESSDAKAIKESLRQVAGDRVKITVFNVRPAGHTDDYLEKWESGDQFQWADCRETGRCSFFSAKLDGGRATENWLAVFDDKGEVIGTVKNCKRKKK